ncbi:MAG: hypothetical protein ACRD4D_01080 [Candidatus Acidiferrales bacterium]
MNHEDTLRPYLERLQRRALVVGVAALGLSAVGFFTAPDDFFRSYLLGYFFWTGIALGSLALLLLHHIFGAGWGFVIQRPLEAAARTVALLAVLFLPLLAGMHSLYEWSHAEAVAADPVLQQKSAYLNAGFFAARVVFYFLAWLGIAHLLSRWSRQLDSSGDAKLVNRLRNAGPPGLLVYGLTATFASVDWVMSLDPHWFSTMFGLMLIAGQVLSALAFVTLVTALLRQHQPLAGVLRPEHLHDHGTLMFAFVMIWAYLSFSQFLIIWSGNVPETITWYHSRSAGGWETLALGLVALHFALPFALLLSRYNKRRADILAGVAGLLLVMRLADLFWIMMPTFHPQGLRLHWLDPVVTIGIGGVWLAFYFYQLKGRPLIPQKDPRMVEALADVEAH